MLVAMVGVALRPRMILNALAMVGVALRPRMMLQRRWKVGVALRPRVMLSTTGMVKHGIVSVGEAYRSCTKWLSLLEKLIAVATQIAPKELG